MVEQFREGSISDTEFNLLSVASLITKVRNGATSEELYRDAIRKFDTLIGLMNDTFADKASLSKFGYSLDELKDVSYLIFRRLISDAHSDPFMILCILEGAPLDEIKRRRNKLLHVFHPDRNPEESSNGSITRKINEAYEKILTHYTNSDIQINHINTNVPHYHSYKKNMKYAVFVMVVVSLVAFLWFMKKYYFF